MRCVEQRGEKMKAQRVVTCANGRFVGNKIRCSCVTFVRQAETLSGGGQDKKLLHVRPDRRGAEMVSSCESDVETINVQCNLVPVCTCFRSGVSLTDAMDYIYSHRIFGYTL